MSKLRGIGDRKISRFCSGVETAPCAPSDQKIGGHFKKINPRRNLIATAFSKLSTDFSICHWCHSGLPRADSETLIFRNFSSTVAVLSDDSQRRLRSSL